jgi:NADP-dependent 3-hydroxy acid dehydrogenase YdfG
MADPPQVVLITGCSTGIGRATAERLAKAGQTVYATARRPESIADLADRGCRTLALDVTDEESMRAGVAAVEEAEGAVGALVNNAGSARAAPSRASSSTSCAGNSRRTSSGSSACASSSCPACAAGAAGGS